MCEASVLFNGCSEWKESGRAGSPWLSVSWLMMNVVMKEVRFDIKRPARSNRKACKLEQTQKKESKRKLHPRITEQVNT